MAGSAAVTTGFAYVLLVFVVALVVATLYFAGKSVRMRWRTRLPPAPPPEGATLLRRAAALLAPVRVPRSADLFSKKRASVMMTNPIMRSEIFALHGGTRRSTMLAPGGPRQSTMLTPGGGVQGASGGALARGGAEVGTALPAGWEVAYDEDGDVRARRPACPIE